MRNYKILIQYDGTKYRGWQVQKSTDMTIQGKIQSVLEELAGHPVEVIGSGRTDAGVHAMGQVANFHIDGDFSKEEIQDYLKHYLPMDIAVMEIEEVEERFHARYNADGTRQASDVTEILEGKDRSKAGYTVSPEGLMLKQVDYAAVVSNK